MGWDDTFDVVVAGSGAGAMTGALVAAASGLRTLILEKTDLLGGTSAYSGASVWLPGTQVQERAKLDDSTENARTYLRALIGDENEAHREAFLEAAPRVVEFLERDPAIEFKWSPFPDYYAAPGRLDLGRSFMPLDLPLAELGESAALVRPPVERDRPGLGHDPAQPLGGGRALIGRLLLAFLNTGNGTVRTGTALTDLIVEDGRVTGVEAAGTRIRAERGVLLAAGGYENDDAMRGDLPGAAAWTMAPGGNTGDAIGAAVRIGAASGQFDQAWWCPGSVGPDGRASFTLGFHGGLMVDGTGRRFFNESLPYDQAGRAMNGHVPAHLIFDSRTKGRLPAIAIPGATAAEHLEAGTWVKADTLPELAERLGLPADALTATVERFNGFAEKGVDEDFHRGEDPYDLFFAAGNDGPNPCLVPVDRPPYYAARMVLSDLGTKGGLRTDTESRVLDASGAAIPSLYAAGNTAASFTGPFYPGPGIPIGSGMAFAYRAVQDMKEGA
ncbi:FAD-dependent oxidoreductase [Spirillospora sp. NPDC029432]|uniref:FAD-dependent oxidoreductase n=1 Tax=Spirillospora sp. NPDC029432 TaxID=3154599 RepID=UPI0034543105